MSDSALGTQAQGTQTQKNTKEDSGFAVKFVNKFYEYILLPADQSILQILPELGHLAPVIMTVGSGLFALLTLNASLGMFALSSVEAYAILSWLQSLAHVAATPTLFFRSDPSTPSQTQACASRFQMITPSRFDFFMKRGLLADFPNAPLYMMSYATGYILQSFAFFNKEIENLGPAYSNRPYLAMIAAGLFISLYSAYIAMYGCDSLLSMFTAILLGLFVGYLISNQNALLFGKWSVNVLFTPELSKREGMDYLCVTTS